MPRQASPPGVFVDELDVLQPINPSTARTEDDYEVYKLTNVTVYSEPTSLTSQPCIANLLHAFSDNLLRVTGRLESVSRDQRKCLKSKPFRPVDISISDVYKFSCGESNGTVTVWALGRAGWFEISPSPAYRDMFAHMVEAMQILWFVLDLYTEGETLRLKKKGGALSAHLVFQEYAEDERFSARSVDEARMAFVRHKQFLIMLWCQRFLKVAWSRTPLVQWFKREFPREFETAKARLEGRPIASEKPAPSTTARTRTSEPGSAVLKPTRHSKTSARTAQTQLPPKKDANWWTATALFVFMQKALNLGAVHPGHLTLNKISRLLVRRYEIDDEEIARHVLIAHASNLRYMIRKNSDKKNMRDLTSEPIYSDLAPDMHELSAAHTRKALLVELRPRGDHKMLGSDMDSSASGDEEEEDSDIGMATPKRRPPRRTRGRLSVLRPKTSKFSGKGKAPKPSKGNGRGKASPPDLSSDEETGDEEQANGMDIDTPTHSTALLSPGKRKRSRLLVEDDADPKDLVSRKRSASASFGLDADIDIDISTYLNADNDNVPEDSEDDNASSPPESDESDSERSETDVPLPLNWRARQHPKQSIPAILPPIVNTPLPQYTPNGPGDTWKCTFDGCRQRVYGASTELGRQLIEDHVGDHANPLLGVVLREGGKEGRDVSNLIKRIREMAEAQTPLFPPESNAAGAVVEHSMLRRVSPIKRVV